MHFLITSRLTYDDPRLILKPKKSEVLTATVGATKEKEHDNPAAKPRTLKRRSSVRAALQLPVDSEYATWKIGAKGHCKGGGQAGVADAMPTRHLGRIVGRRMKDEKNGLGRF